MSRRLRICMAKGGRESARPSYGQPKLTLISRRKKITFGGVPKTWQVTILTIEQNPPERKFSIRNNSIMIFIGVNFFDMSGSTNKSAILTSYLFYAYFIERV